jgi:energy-coupling factor transport system ATP-binding protein
VHELVLRLRAEGRSVLLVTKDLDEFMAAADDLILLEHGRVVAQGAPRDVIATHGAAMLEMGVWLPEPATLGQRLAARWPGRGVPLTVAEAADGLAGSRFRPAAAAARAPTGGEVLVEARHLRYAYGSFLALDDVSFQIRQGEIVAIVGQNGAGKSTLSKLLVGLLRPTSGELTLFGRPAQRWRVHELANEVALVFQNPEHQFLSDTVFEELAYSLLAQNVDDPAEVKQRVDAMLQRLDIAEAAASHPFALSAGAKRRLGVATMLVGGRARLLIVDEPTYGQDKRLTDRLMELLGRLRAEGITILMITHDMRLVDAHAERALVMADGRLLFDGAPSALFQQPELLARASLRTTALRRVIDCLRQRGVTVPPGLHTVEAFCEALEPA